MSESKIPWPIWAAVMLACAVIAAWASRPQTDGQTVEDLKKEINSLKAQLNPRQPTYSPSVSEPSPSPTAITTPTPTITTEPTPTPTSERTPSLSDPKWDYSVFNSRKTYSDAEIQYILKSGARYDDSNKQVEWIVDKKINCFKICFKFEISEIVFTALFKDRDAVTIGTQVLFEDGKDYPKRYTLTIPDSVWSRWSEVSQVIIEKQ